jgi:hypothetical protein
MGWIGIEGSKEVKILVMVIYPLYMLKLVAKMEAKSPIYVGDIYTLSPYW